MESVIVWSRKIMLAGKAKHYILQWCKSDLKYQAECPDVEKRKNIWSHIQVCLQLFPPNNSFLFLFVQMTKEKWEDLPKIIQLINVLDSWTHALSTFRRCFSNSLCWLYYLSCNKGSRSGYQMHGCWFYLSWTSLLASGPTCSSSQSP